MERGCGTSASSCNAVRYALICKALVPSSGCRRALHLALAGASAEDSPKVGGSGAPGFTLWYAALGAGLPAPRHKDHPAVELPHKWEAIHNDI